MVQTIRNNHETYDGGGAANFKFKGLLEIIPRTTMTESRDEAVCHKNSLH